MKTLAFILFFTTLFNVQLKAQCDISITNNKSGCKSYNTKISKIARLTIENKGLSDDKINKRIDKLIAENRRLIQMANIQDANNAWTGSKNNRWREKLKANREEINRLQQKLNNINNDYIELLFSLTKFNCPANKEEYQSQYFLTMGLFMSSHEIGQKYASSITKGSTIEIKLRNSQTVILYAGEDMNISMSEGQSMIYNFYYIKPQDLTILKNAGIGTIKVSTQAYILTFYIDDQNKIIKDITCLEEL